MAESGPLNANPLNAGPSIMQWGYECTLYASGNEMPAAHLSAGLAMVALTTSPLTLLMAGFSNSRQAYQQMLRWNRAYNNALALKTDTLVEMQSDSGQAKRQYMELDAGNNPYNETASRLTAQQITELQIGVASIATARNDTGYGGLHYIRDDQTFAGSYLETGLSQWGTILRLMKTKYTNLRILLLWGRCYGGYADDSHNNPEPLAWEEGLLIKLLIEEQIRQEATGIVGGTIGGATGDLRYSNGSVPWIDWAFYHWSGATGSAGNQTPVVLPYGKYRGASWPLDYYEQTIGVDGPNGDKAHCRQGGEWLDASCLWDVFQNHFALAPIRTL